jgi:anti-sigma B factor antagonist
MRLIGDKQEHARILALGGEIDLHFVPVFRALLDEPTGVASGALVLDLSEVSFIDSTGIAAIIEHLRSATRGSKAFCIGGMSETVKEIFKIINLQKAMPVFETREAALEAFEEGLIKQPQNPLFAAAD